VGLYKKATFLPWPPHLN